MPSRPLAIMLSLADMCDHLPVVAPEIHDTGAHRLRFIPTPHIPHNCEAGTLALMHCSSFTGDGAAQLRGLADAYAVMTAAAGTAATT